MGTFIPRLRVAPSKVEDVRKRRFGGYRCLIGIGGKLEIAANSASHKLSFTKDSSAAAQTIRMTVLLATMFHVQLCKQRDSSLALGPWFFCFITTNWGPKLAAHVNEDDYLCDMHPV